MKRMIVGLQVFLLMSAVAFPCTSLNGQSKEAASPYLASLIITIEPNVTSPASCLQLLPTETITVYAVGLDENGKPYVIPKGATVHWSGGDALEIKSNGDHSATVKLVKPLKAAVAHLSNHLSYEGKSFGSSVQIAQRVKELPKSFLMVFQKDPAKDKTLDIEKMKIGESITVYVRGLSNDMATMGEVFTLPLDTNISWKAVPSPPMGAEIKITQIGCHSAKIEVVKPPQMEGMPNSVKVEAGFKDGTRKEAAFSIEVTK